MGLAQGITVRQGQTQDLNSDLEVNTVILEARVTQRVPLSGLGKGTLHLPPPASRFQTPRHDGRRLVPTTLNKQTSRRTKRKIKSYKTISIILTNGNKNLDINDYIKYIWT